MTDMPSAWTRKHKIHHGQYGHDQSDECNPARHIPVGPESRASYLERLKNMAHWGPPSLHLYKGAVPKAKSNGLKAWKSWPRQRFDLFSVGPRGRHGAVMIVDGDVGPYSYHQAPSFATLFSFVWLTSIDQSKLFPPPFGFDSSDHDEYE